MTQPSIGSAVKLRIALPRVARKPAMDHVVEYEDRWTFCAGTDPSAPNAQLLEIPKEVADTSRVATIIADHMMLRTSVAYDVGQEEGRKQAQRFFRLAMGVEVPTPSERALWGNPVPLKEEE